MDDCEKHVLTAMDAIVVSYRTSAKICRIEVCFAMLNDDTLSKVYKLNDEGLKCPNYKTKTELVVTYLMVHLENDDDMKLFDVIDQFVQGQFVPQIIQ